MWQISSVHFLFNSSSFFSFSIGVAKESKWVAHPSQISSRDSASLPLTQINCREESSDLRCPFTSLKNCLSLPWDAIIFSLFFVVLVAAACLCIFLRFLFAWFFLMTRGCGLGARLRYIGYFSSLMQPPGRKTWLLFSVRGMYWALETHVLLRFMW